MSTITRIAYGDAQTRGQLRHWKTKLAERYAVFDRALKRPAVGDAAIDMVRGSGITRRNALARLAGLFGPGATFERAEIKKRGGYALWSILKPRGSVFVEAIGEMSAAEVASMSQDAVTVTTSSPASPMAAYTPAKACGRSRSPTTPLAARSNGADS